jgi:hypothetical protein
VVNLVNKSSFDFFFAFSLKRKLRVIKVITRSNFLYIISDIDVAGEN